jgi:cyclopropane fatty-acyl-phospholipid synthase-like methyltransferase
MNRSFLNQLLEQASDMFRPGGRFAYHYARGKLGSDPIFRELLRQGVLSPGGHLLDLGCGQGSLFAWLLVARRQYEQGAWPADWPAPPLFDQMRGVELMPRDVQRAAAAFAQSNAQVRVEQGDMNTTDFGHADVVTILDALHYFDHDRQQEVLRRIHAALPVGGLFLTRIGDAGAGLPFRMSIWVDHVATFVRGHRLPRLYCRPLADWVGLLEATGFAVTHEPMSEGKPFANVMLVCRKRDGASPTLPH